MRQPITWSEVFELRRRELGYTQHQLREAGRRNTKHVRSLISRALQNFDEFHRMWQHAEQQGWFKPGRVVVLGGERLSV